MNVRSLDDTADAGLMTSITAEGDASHTAAHCSLFVFVACPKWGVRGLEPSHFDSSKPRQTPGSLSVENLASHWNGYSRARSGSAWHVRIVYLAATLMF